MFNLLNQLSYSKDALILDKQGFIHTPGISKFDLNLTAIDYGIQIGFNLEYSTKLFKPESIERYIDYFRRIINGISINVNQLVFDIEIISLEEKYQLLHEFNNTKADYPKDKTIHKLFEEQVERTPHRTVLVFGDETITYHELNCRANRIARNLINMGICVEDRVGIIFERSIDMIAQIFGIIKSGGAYVPISPSYPEPRIEYILSNCNAKLLLAQKELSDKLHFTSPTIVYDDLDLSAIQDKNLNLAIEPSNLSYIIYTSGSTGNPKGVQVEHGSVVNLLYFLQEKYPVNTNDLYLFKTSFCFDVSISELFGWIIGGGKLSILELGFEKDPIGIANAIYRDQVTHINFVPSAFNLFSQTIKDSDKYKLRSLKYVMLAGEALLRKHLNNFFEIKPEIRIENLYGPTETTVYASHYSVSHQNNTPIYIGKPISNYCACILDRSGKLQPIGIAG
jgi:amino acid adenylation domain-containing protein